VAENFADEISVFYVLAPRVNPNYLFAAFESELMREESFMAGEISTP
jgi:hypothetical protein